MGNYNPMHKPSHSKSIDIKDLSRRLQEEVDSILGNVDESALFAEFDRDEIVDLQTENGQEVVHHIVDERMIISPRKHRISTNAAPKKIHKKAKTVFRYLFTPFSI